MKAELSSSTTPVSDGDQKTKLVDNMKWLSSFIDQRHPPSHEVLPSRLALIPRAKDPSQAVQFTDWDDEHDIDYRALGCAPPVGITALLLAATQYQSKARDDIFELLVSL
jgi:hypothetical protein